MVKTKIMKSKMDEMNSRPTTSKTKPAKTKKPKKK